MTKPVTVVLSGGQDSTTCLFWALEGARREGLFPRVDALTFNYHQRHQREIEAAKHVFRYASLLYPDLIGEHEILPVGPILKGRSPLTDHGGHLEQYDSYESMVEEVGDRVENTFVPMRNALFLTVAANHAVCNGSFRLVTGVCQQDSANYPDCRADFITSQQDTINLALGLTGAEMFHVYTPLMNMTKADSILFAYSITGAYEALAWSHTAYDGQYPPVSHDHASLLRSHGFREADLPDPLVLRANLEGKMLLPRQDNYDLQRERIRLAVDKVTLNLANYRTRVEKI